MNIANVSERFITLTGIDESQLPKWRFLLDDAAEYVGSRATVQNPDASQQSRLEALCAAYAFRLFCICSDSDSVSSFTAGDVSFSSPADERLKSAEALWKELCRGSADVFRQGAEVFRRVM